MAELERIYTIPLRREIEKVPRYKRATKAVKAIREFLVRHMRVYDRDLKKVRIERWLNMHIWERGIKNPPTKIRVKAVKDGDIVRVELAELPKKALKEEKKKKKLEEKRSKSEKKKEEKQEEVKEGTEEVKETKEKKLEEEVKEEVEEKRQESEKKSKKK
ncbi:MAG: 50S ribosomal protein L31e [Nanoarchaeota archaeon]